MTLIQVLRERKEELSRLSIIRPELFETILSRMQQALEAPQSVANPRIVLHRCLMYLFDAVATLSSNRMQKGKAVMGEVSCSLLCKLFWCPGLARCT
jgi:hypothetical protein